MLQQSLLLKGRLEFVLVGFADALLLHRSPFCLRDTKAVTFGRFVT
jgi:hypothetical protein